MTRGVIGRVVLGVWLGCVTAAAAQLPPEIQMDRHLVRAISDVLPVSMKKIDRVKRRFVEQGLEAALDKRKAEWSHTRKADGDFEAHLVALSCSKSPPGHARWSLRLLADRMVALNYVDAISHETVRRVLKKRTEALEEALGDSTRKQWRVCGGYGAGAGCLSTAL